MSSDFLRDDLINIVVPYIGQISIFRKKNWKKPTRNM